MSRFAGHLPALPLPVADQGQPALGNLLRRDRQRLAAAEFEDFCDRHLAHLDAVAAEFFASPTAGDAIQKKVTALYPAHEVEQFTELFIGRIRRWTELEGRG